MSDLLTKWSVRDIQAAITEGGSGVELFIPNVSWGFFRGKGMEADLLWVHGTRLEEFEIKRSKSDFIADFKKSKFHEDVRISKLHFVLPEALAGEWLKTFCATKYQTFKRSFDFMFYSESDCAIIRPAYHNNYTVDPKFTTPYYLTNSMLGYINEHDPARDYYRKLFDEERLTLFRLAVIRFWTHERGRLYTERRKRAESESTTDTDRTPDTEQDDKATDIQERQ